MIAIPIIPDSAPFSSEQRSWLNGFLAGMLSRGESSASTEPARAQIPLLIAFGSQSGNSESLAKAIGKQATAKGFAVKIAGLDAVKAADFVQSGNVLVITSTWGEGDMPDNATAFWDTLNQNGASPALSGVRFSVLALGDKNYGDTFCLAGRKMDERLEQLGAQRIHARVECDVDFDEPAKTWIEGVFKSLEGASSNAPAPPAPATQDVNEEAPAETGYSKKNPFPAPLIANVKLTGERSAKDTRHFALSLAGSGLAYETGDALGLIARNDIDVVNTIISAHGFTGDEIVPLPDGGNATLRDALISKYEVRAQLGKTLEKPISPTDFIESLRKLQPRLYSIASSLKAHPDEVHLCVAAVRYETNGLKHQGVASTFLAERLPLGHTTGVFIHTAKHFRVPTDGETPMIMVGPGTGVAPFRAFLEERQVVGAKGRNWLFFGDQKRKHDFLYEEQILNWVNDGHLTRLDIAFSRDQAEKVYVQDRMMSAASELWQWLESGAHFYVCGDASRMAKDVDAALHKIIQQQSGSSEEDATAYVAEMKKSKRYARDVY